MVLKENGDKGGFWFSFQSTWKQTEKQDEEDSHLKGEGEVCPP